MRSTKQIGDRGEQIAIDFLLGSGFELVARNYRYKRAEVDLIVRKSNCLVFVEVKYRSGTAFGFPEQVVNDSKKKLIYSAAENFVFENNWTEAIRFDIIAIVDQSGKQEVVHFKDAF